MVICCFLGVLFHRVAAEGAVGYPALLSGWLLSEVSASDQFTQFAYIQVLQEGEAVFPPVPFEGKVRSWANEGEMAQPPTQWMWAPVVLRSKAIAAWGCTGACSVCGGNPEGCWWNCFPLGGSSSEAQTDTASRVQTCAATQQQVSEPCEVCGVLLPVGSRREYLQVSTGDISS